MPKWCGGMPNDGGGFDQEMIAKIAQLKTGQQVDVTWEWNERKRLGTLNERWTNWSSLTMSQVILWVIGPGKDGPVPTERLRLLQESLQESELRILVQDALLDPVRKAKLGADLAKRVEQLCNDRTRQLRYFSLFFGSNGNDLGRIMDQSRWQTEAEKLCRLADEVAKALR